MNEMIERAAKAAHDSVTREPVMAWENCHPNYRLNKMAEMRAAVEAMREPTEAMTQQAAVLHTHQGACATDYGYDAQPDQMGDIWRAMIDAALK